MPSLTQRRAIHALKEVLEIKRLQEEATRNDKKPSAKNGFQYRSYVEGFPATILQIGLGQALASLLSQAKGDKEHDRYRLYNSLQSWLCGDDPDMPFSRYQPSRDFAQAPRLIAALTTCEEHIYLHAHAEALAYLEWLKKFAAAELQKATREED